MLEIWGDAGDWFTSDQFWAVWPELELVHLKLFPWKWGEEGLKFSEMGGLHNMGRLLMKWEVLNPFKTMNWKTFYVFHWLLILWWWSKVIHT